VTCRALAADAVVLTDGRVLLLERTHPPFEGAWVLPGGMVEAGETSRAAAEREVREEVGADVVAGECVGLYDDPDRDPRGTVSVAYRCRLAATSPSPAPRAEANAVDWFRPGALPETGFDHARIVRDAVG
jgi:8-oxo-dGTP diphosphatase